MTFLAVIGAVVLAVALLVPVAAGLMLLGGGVSTFTWAQQYDGETVTVRRRFGRETGWRWVEDHSPAQGCPSWQYGVHSFDDTPIKSRATLQQAADTEDE